ncbi:hypothetical protein [Oceanobacillus polygoni]|uniref:Uncharacterized protein n=1 Tax=Oceanobacillus polygoni TaxID=1235259 RepID=A0A9X0YVD1_9BACI|nr:hypothetical protein [Oceanobacillus polygoni]MBP2078005.1 hypothetical protein [Oceanobacillus polygoni]
MKNNRVLHLERTSSGGFREVKKQVVRNEGLKVQQEDSNSFPELLDKLKGIMKTLNTSEVKLVGNMAKDYIKQFFQNDSVNQEEQYTEEKDEHKAEQEIESKDAILVMLHHALDDPAVQEQIWRSTKELVNDKERFNQLLISMADTLQKK